MATRSADRVCYPFPFVSSLRRVLLTKGVTECAKRWKQCLDPQLDRSEWTEEEVSSASPCNGEIINLLRQSTGPSLGGGCGSERKKMERDSDRTFPFPVSQFHQKPVSLLTTKRNHQCRLTGHMQQQIYHSHPTTEQVRKRQKQEGHTTPRPTNNQRNCT